jgi:hypothetical protein
VSRAGPSDSRARNRPSRRRSSARSDRRPAEGRQRRLERARRGLERLGLGQRDRRVVLQHLVLGLREVGDEDQVLAHRVRGRELAQPQLAVGEGRGAHRQPQEGHLPPRLHGDLLGLEDARGADRWAAAHPDDSTANRPDRNAGWMLILRASSCDATADG